MQKSKHLVFKHYSLQVTLRTTRFDIKKFYIVITWNWCVSYGSRKKQHILPYEKSKD